MDSQPSISLHTPLTKNLSKRQSRLVEKLTELLQAKGLRISEGLDTDRIEDRYARLCKTQGSIVVAFAQWEASRLYREQEKSCVFPSEFAHVAITMAVSAKKPLLVFREKNVAERGALKRGYIHPVIDIPTNAEPGWLESPAFQKPFAQWLNEVNAHKNVFLGYSSQAKETALAIRTFLEKKLNLSILDWHDFQASGIILQNIEESERLATVGVFLFMKDDRLKKETSHQGAPRDNVIYEAGFFAGAKGHERTLIIRESGAKVPSDLGGVIYLEIPNKSNISSIETKLREYFESVFSG